MSRQGAVCRYTPVSRRQLIEEPLLRVSNSEITVAHYFATANEEAWPTSSAPFENIESARRFDPILDIEVVTPPVSDCGLVFSVRVVQKHNAVLC